MNTQALTTPLLLAPALRDSISRLAETWTVEALHVVETLDPDAMLGDQEHTWAHTRAAALRSCADALRTALRDDTERSTQTGRSFRTPVVTTAAATPSPDARAQALLLRAMAGQAPTNLATRILLDAAEMLELLAPRLSGGDDDAS